jgi:hypothetical protein
VKAARFHQATIKRAVHAAQKAGLRVQGIEVAPDGTIRVLTGEDAPPELTPLEQWEVKHAPREAPARVPGKRP